MIRRLSLPGAVALVAALSAAPLAVAQDPPEAPAPAPAPVPEPAAKAPEPPAQPKAPEAPRRSTRPGDVQKVFVLQHLLAADVARLLEVFPARVTYATNSRLQALSVSAAPAVVAAIEETIKRLDVSPASQNVVVTAYILEGLTQAGESSGLPAELADVLGQLKQTFGFAGCRLVDTVIARGTHDRNFGAESVAKSEGAAHPTIYEMMARKALVVRGAASSTIRLTGFHFKADVTVQTGSNTSRRGISLSSDISIRDGQTVVVGKTAPSESGNAQILVLRAQIVD